MCLITRVYGICIFVIYYVLVESTDSMMSFPLQFCICMLLLCIGMVGHRGGVMTARGRVPMMGIGGGGYPLAGHPVDYYCNPYLDEKVDCYGGGRPPYHRGIGKLMYHCA